MNWGSSCSFVA